MKKLMGAFVLVVLSMAGAWGQSPYKLVTHPKLPAREALDRLNLTLAWHARLPIHGNRDGLFSVQVIPGLAGPQLVVQTYEGRVALFDGETGDQLWATPPVGLPFHVDVPAGYNDTSLLVMRRNVLHILSRTTGLQRLVTEDPDTKVRTYGFTLPGAPSTAPVADGNLVYVVMGTRLDAYALPKLGAEGAFEDTKPAPAKPGTPPAGGAGSAPKPAAYASRTAGPGDGKAQKGDGGTRQPTLIWTKTVGDNFVQTQPLLYGRSVMISTTGGRIQSFDVLEGVRRYEIQTDGAINYPAAQHGNMAYVSEENYNVYAVAIDTGGIAWRYVAGAGFARGPQANDAGVFIFPNRLGMRRLQRDTGRPLWENERVDRFLATSGKFVYAMDAARTFHVLDGLRGTSLATHDLSGWALPVANEWTDRIYLASNDGQIVCLRHRDLPAPLTMKEFRKPEVKKPAEEKQEEEKKEEEKKEEKQAAAPAAPAGREPAVLVAGDEVVQSTRRHPLLARRDEPAGP